MQPPELLKYLEKHREATIGTPGSFAAAKMLVEKGLAKQIGMKNQMPIIEITPKGSDFLRYAEKKMGGKSAVVKGDLKTVGGLIQDYGTAFKAEHPIGIFSEMGMSSGIGAGQHTDVFSMGDLSLIPTEPAKKIVNKKTKALPKEIQVGGAKYKLET